MIARDVQMFKVTLVGLHFGPIDEVESHADEDLLDFFDRAREDVPAAQMAVPPRQRNVDAFPFQPQSERPTDKFISDTHREPELVFNDFVELSWHRLSTMRHLAQGAFSLLGQLRLYGPAGVVQGFPDSGSLRFWQFAQQLKKRWQATTAAEGRAANPPHPPPSRGRKRVLPRYPPASRPPQLSARPGALRSASRWSLRRDYTRRRATGGARSLHPPALGGAFAPC